MRSLAGILALSLAAAAASGGALQEALFARDVLGLEHMSLTDSTSEPARLAAGAAFSLRHRDDAALALLTPLAGSGANAEIRGSACWAMSDVLLRQGRYAELRDAMRCAEAAGHIPAESGQVLNYAGVLAGEKAMRVTGAVEGRIKARRDRGGMVRVPVMLGGHEEEAVIDTDASFCVISRSMARRFGVRVLEPAVTIITTARADQPMHLGIAAELKLGDTVFTDVVFAVLDDAAMQFRSDYRMDVVLGLPVLIALHRIEISETGGLSLIYGARAASDAKPNMALSGLDPFALLEEPHSGAVLCLAIDSAASNTTLNAGALRAFPALAEGSTGSTARWSGVGGNRSDGHARVIQTLRLAVGARPLSLPRVQVLSDEEADRHGAIGEDLLRQGSNWVLDFDAMRFEIGE
jgi:hypothetical protein